ncbi:MAG: filamentous hemagglutinin N-terminal domain-containing protein [Scytonema sp. RU_4_4]|nr:filamentous hemagglutinin N-terminal domain-containing protein [Scytonema sp. RU_4_4]
MNQVHHPLFFLALPLATLATLAPLTTAVAQVSADGTVSTTVTSPDGKTFNINDGTTRGTNLFHSFKEFSVPTGGSANFNNATSIQHIISRVTGGSVSNIDGLIKALGNANLFLLNPAGIIFGPNAQLNIGGSFLGSTANSFIFDNGFEFSATNPEAPPLLTINIPIGLRFRDKPGSITTQSANLEVPSGNSLTLVGGNVSLDKGKLTAPGGRIELGGLSVVGEVGLNENGSLNFPNNVDNVARADVSVTNGTSIDVRAGGGGFITINAGNLKVTGESKLLAGIEKDLGTLEAQAGDVKINASDTVSFDESTVENQVAQNAKGNAGNIDITTNSLFLSNRASLNANTLGMGNSGQVMIRADDTISLANGSSIRSRVSENAVGNSGGIDITTQKLSLTNNANLSATTEGKGNSGRVMIRAGDTISLADESFINSRVASDGVGNSGGINITTEKLFLTNDAEFNASNSGKGDAGQVTIRADDTISLADESFIHSRVSENAVGNSGGIDITTQKLSLTNDAHLSATTDGKGNSGQVTIRAGDTISLDDESFINSRVSDDGVGDSGGIDITTEKLFLTNNARLDASNSGQGNAGQVMIRAGDTISLVNKSSIIATTDGTGNAGQVTIRAGDTISLADESFIQSRVSDNGVGNSGGIDITTQKLSLTNKANLSATTDGKGNSGQVTIRAGDTISLSDGSLINSRVSDDGVGDSGGIDITTEKLFLTNNAALNASSTGDGAAGDIEVAARSIRLDNGSTIKADTVAGQGNINLNARDFVLLRDGSKITTNATGTATGGNIIINTNNLVAFPEENSDITAKSDESFGGRISINTNGGIFGIEYRQQETEFSDITASSALGPQFSGTVQLNTPDVNPSQGLFELSETVIDPAQQIAQNPCLRGGGEFLITGRGGFPSNPNKIFGSDNVRVDLVKPVASTTRNSTSTTKSQPSTSATDKPIVPARGWIFNEKGEVTLVAYDPTKTGPQRSSPTPVSCAAPR